MRRLLTAAVIGLVVLTGIVRIARGESIGGGVAVIPSGGSGAIIIGPTPTQTPTPTATPTPTETPVPTPTP